MATINFCEKNDLLVLQYQPENGCKWIFEKLNELGNISIKNVFVFSQEYLVSENRSFVSDSNDLLEDRVDENLEYENLDLDHSDQEIDINEAMEFEELVEFKIADKVGSYFKFDKTVLGISFDLYISRDVQLELKSFRAEKGISIFRKINELGLGPSMYIGGEKEFALPEKEFRYLLDNFPNTYELKKYASARISSVLRNYLGIKTDHEKKYRDYLDKKISKKGTDVKDLFRATEEVKFLALYEKLIEMLEGKNSYNESQWQNEILQIILLLYPKYIYVIEEAKIRDTYNQKTRRLDFLLIDSSGNTDIVEIKQPFDQCIVSRNTYRDNYIPVKELSGSVMQVEKYIFYLNKWGKKGEQALTEKYKKELPDEFQIKITNPSGIIIMGREHNLSLEQRQDFEVIKRKYKNVIDIITYDDLLKRLKFIIDQLSS